MDVWMLVLMLMSMWMLMYVLVFAFVKLTAVSCLNKLQNVSISIIG
ncbi:hypothetical protein ACFPYJ_19175 [Paenibacillus solisilvae]|uniref:ATP synthase F0 subunit 8 n=1 Tax=Paenibacillus solisilvae TaxID=2486751 RepID=A0ABW0W2C9_9BACL